MKQMNPLNVFVFVMAGVLSGWAVEPAASEVEQELARFEKTRPTKVQPTDPRFGVIRVLSLLNLDFPGMEKVKAASQARWKRDT